MVATAASPLRARWLSPRNRDGALAHLASNPRANLFLLDLVAGAGDRRGGEVPPQIVVVSRDGAVTGVASLRPSVVLDASIGEEEIDVLMPFFEAVEAGLMKSRHEAASLLWQRLSARGLRAIVDRVEFSYIVKGPAMRPAELAGAMLRRAEPRDLDALVHAARASLREEGRPDPFDADPMGFRRWVRGRLYRARVVETGGAVVFVGYADVRRRDGWLVQGVYTWPAARRKGFASLGMRSLVAEALSAGAEHVQLSVVDGNEAAVGLYEGIGFQPVERLRTVLFG